MKQKSLGVNAILNGIKQCCSIIFPLITFPYISRVLGSDGYGKYSFSYSVTNYFILLAALGIYTYAIREGAKIREDKKKLDKFCSQVFSINVCSAVISLLLLSMIAILLPKFSGYKAYIFIQSTAIIMAVIGTDWVNGIFEDYFYITVRYIAVQCVCLIAMFVFVREPGDVIPYCIISVLATNGGNLINVFYVRKYAKIRFTFDMDLKRHLMPLLILFVNSIAISIYVNSDITMLGFFESDTQVGVYSFASKIYNLLKQLINAVIVVSVPRISYIINNRPEEYKMFLNRIFSGLNIVLLPIVVGMFFMSDSMILIAGGEQYISGDTSLKILSVATLFAIYASLFTNCVTAELINCFMQIRFSTPFFDWKKLELRPNVSCICGSIFIGIICILCNCFINGYLLRMACAVLLSTLVYGITLIVLKNPCTLAIIDSIVKKNR